MFLSFNFEIYLIFSGLSLGVLNLAIVIPQVIFYQHIISTQLCVLLLPIIMDHWKFLFCTNYDNLASCLCLVPNGSHTGVLENIKEDKICYQISMG